jgi:hypothetical protein
MFEGTPLGVELPAAVVLAVSACASGSDAATNPDAAAGPDAAADSTEAADVALLEFAQCMRDEGIDMPDPGPEGLASLRAEIDEGSPAFSAALDACAELLEGYYQEAHGADHDDEERREELQLERVQCMRDEGIDMPDPGPGQHGFEGLDPNDPVVRAALEECFGDVGHGAGH